MFEFDSGFVFLPLEAAQVYFQTDGGVSYLDVTVTIPIRSARSPENWPSRA